MTLSIILVQKFLIVIFKQLSTYLKKAVTNQTEPTQEDVIHSWHMRAHAYDKLIERWPIFTNMVDRLLEFIPEKFDGNVFDIGGGTGLLADHLLRRHPKACVTLVEPAQDMRALALLRLGDRVEIRNATSDKLELFNLTADAAFCSASFHLMKEETTLPSVASVLNHGALFATNLWGHSFDETIALDKKLEWMQFVDQALNEFDQPLMHRPKKTARRIKSAKRLQKIGEACGLHLLETKIVTTEIKTQFNIEFAAMDFNFLNQVETDIRMQVIDRALKLCHGVDTISSVDLYFEKF